MLQDAILSGVSGDGFDLSVGLPSPQPSPGVTVLVMQSGADRSLWMAQLLRRPDVSLLLIDPRACEAELVELWPLRRAQGVVDGGAIATAVRSATSWELRSPPPGLSGA